MAIGWRKTVEDGEKEEWRGMRPVGGDQQECWARERERRRLVPGNTGFAKDGLMAHLDEPGVLVTVMPSTPLRQPVDFSDALLSLLRRGFSGQTRKAVPAMDRETSTAGALVCFATGGTDSWRAFVAARRDGGTDVGFGSLVRSRRDGGEQQGSWAYRLYILVNVVRVAIETQSRLLEWFHSEGLAVEELQPFELAVAIPAAGGSILIGLAEGWDRVVDDFEPTPSCLEPDPLIRIQVDHWPQTEEEREDLLGRVADRIGNAFGSVRRRHLPPWDQAGRLAPEYA